MKTLLSWLLTSLLSFDVSFVFAITETPDNTVSSTISAPKRKLRMAYTDFPPFQINSSEGPKGLQIEQAKKIIARAGYDLELVYVPFKRMTNEFASGNFDVWLGLTHYKEFKGTTFMGSKEVGKLELMIYAFGQDIPIKNLADLKKYRIITYSGYTYGGLITDLQNPENKYQVLEVKDMDQAYRLLINRRADICLNYKATVETWMKGDPTKRLRGHLFKTMPYHFAVSRKALEGNEILKNLEQAIPTAATDAP